MPNRFTLKAYLHTMTMAVACGKTANRLPQCEQHALANQLRRAGYSAVLNIAEGASRTTIKQQLQYYGIARSSIHEARVILEIAVAMEYLDQAEAGPLQELCDEAGRTLFGYMLSVESQLTGMNKLKGTGLAVLSVLSLLTYLVFAFVSP